MQITNIAGLPSMSIITISECKVLKVEVYIDEFKRENVKCPISIQANKRIDNNFLLVALSGKWEIFSII